MSKNKLILNKVPIVIKKGSNIMINQHLFRDTIIYDSKDLNYFKGKYERVSLFNRQNVFTNSSRLIAKFGTENGKILEKTSDGIVKLIGQDQFEVLFMALCSIINQEIRIRGLISILTTNKLEKLEQSNVQTDLKLKKVDVGSQTNEMRLDKINVNRKRRMRKQLAPYVVQDYKTPEKIKKVTVDISTYNKTTSNSSNEFKEIPDLGYLHDENSNDTNISTITCETTPELLTDPYSFLKDIDDCTDKRIHTVHENNPMINEPHENSIKIMNLDNQTDEILTDDGRDTFETIHQNCFNLILPDNTSVMLPAKPEDHFHIATEENLRVVDSDSRKKLIEIQRIIDLKFCMTVDDEGNLPIHNAVLNEDLHLLKRQCFMLNLKDESVDIEANRLTPLKLSLFNESVSTTAILLSFGADPLFLDESHSTYFHTAAELNTEHLSVLLQYCKNNARTLIGENENLQLPGWEEKSDDVLSSHLMDHICSIYDNQGYTPLMLATNLGLYSNVRALLAHSPSSVRARSPTTGNTVLYLAVVAACNVSAERNNKSKLVDNFRQTIETLLDYGADTTIDNYSGSNVSVLLTDFQCPELSMLIANKGPASKYNNTTSMANYDSLILIKDEKMNIKKLNDKNKKTMQLKNFRKIKEKPVVLESVVLSKNHTDSVVKSDSYCRTDLSKINSNLINSNLINSIKKHDDSNSSHVDSTKTEYNVIRIDLNSIKKHDNSNSSRTDTTKCSNIIKIESDSIQNHDNSNSSHVDSTKTEYNVIRIEPYSIKKLNNSNLSRTNTIKIKSESIQNHDNSNSSHVDSTKTNSNRIKINSDSIIITRPTKSNSNSIKEPASSTKNILESSEKSIKISSNKIIVNKPDKIILTPVKLVDVDKSIDSIEKIDSSNNSIKKIINETISNNIKGNNSQNLKSKSDYDPQSNEMSSDIRLLYSPNSIKRDKHLQSHDRIISVQNRSIELSINRESNPKSESLTATKAKPKVYIKKTIPGTKKSIKKKIDDNNCKVPVPPKTCKRKISGSE